MVLPRAQREAHRRQVTYLLYRVCVAVSDLSPVLSEMPEPAQPSGCPGLPQMDPWPDRHQLRARRSDALGNYGGPYPTGIVGDRPSFHGLCNALPGAGHGDLMPAAWDYKLDPLRGPSETSELTNWTAPGSLAIGVAGRHVWPEKTPLGQEKGEENLVATFSAETRSKALGEAPVRLPGSHVEVCRPWIR